MLGLVSGYGSGSDSEGEGGTPKGVSPRQAKKAGGLVQKKDAEPPKVDAVEENKAENGDANDVTEEDDPKDVLVDIVGLPPPPPEICSQDMQNKVAKYLKNFDDVDFTSNLKNKKDFGNPYILPKVVEFFKINQTASNYPVELFDPAAYPPGDYIEGIMSRQKAHDRKVAELKKQEAVRRKSASKPPPPGGPPGGIQGSSSIPQAAPKKEGRKPRQSKWSSTVVTSSSVPVGAPPPAATSAPLLTGSGTNRNAQQAMAWALSMAAKKRDAGDISGASQAGDAKKTKH